MKGLQALGEGLPRNGLQVLEGGEGPRGWVGIGVGVGSRCSWTLAALGPGLGGGFWGWGSGDAGPAGWDGDRGGARGGGEVLGERGDGRGSEIRGRSWGWKGLGERLSGTSGVGMLGHVVDGGGLGCGGGQKRVA